METKKQRAKERYHQAKWKDNSEDTSWIILDVLEEYAKHGGVDDIKIHGTSLVMGLVYGMMGGSDGMDFFQALQKLHNVAPDKDLIKKYIPERWRDDWEFLEYTKCKPLKYFRDNGD